MKSSIIAIKGMSWGWGGCHLTGSKQLQLHKSPYDGSKVAPEMAGRGPAAYNHRKARPNKAGDFKHLSEQVRSTFIEESGVVSGGGRVLVLGLHDRAFS